MKFSILVDMLFDLLSKRKITAAYLAEKYNLSPRTIYRYVDLLATKLPLSVKRGRNGGIFLSDTYRLPVGFMSDVEYEAAIEALISAYAIKPETRFLEAKRKLSAQIKAENKTLLATGEIGDLIIEDLLPSFSEKTRILGECIQTSRLVEIEYITGCGQTIADHIEPHALLLRKGVWQVYAFCHLTRNFQLFTLGRITTLIQTNTTFRKRPFHHAELTTSTSKEKYISVQLAIAEDAVDKMCDCLGAETLQKSGGQWTTELKFPDSETAIRVLLGLGKSVKVLSPLSLQKKLCAVAEEISQLYH